MMVIPELTGALISKEIGTQLEPVSARHVPTHSYKNRGANKSLARPTSRCILFDGENISLMLVLFYI